MRGRDKAGRDGEVKTWQRKSLPVWAPPGETHCLQNKQCNEKDKGGLRSGRRHEMTHKHTEPRLSPSQSPSLTSSAPSCESPPPYLQSGLRRAARGSCSSSGVCRTAHSYLNHAQTASPHSSHICCDERRQQYRKKYDQAEVDVPRPRKTAMCGCSYYNTIFLTVCVFFYFYL